LIFFLGTHKPHWLSAGSEPLFLSRNVLRHRKAALPRATCDWCLDSGGFTELSANGRWTVDASQYAAEVRRWSEEAGRMRWAAVQDWMCEPAILTGGSLGVSGHAVGTGLTVEEHQRRTVASYLDLTELAPGIPWAPVLQGWEPADYTAHLLMYEEMGADLSSAPVILIGSMCRRQKTNEAARILADIVSDVRSLWGIGCHALGFSRIGLAKLAQAGVELESADSAAWSYHARRRPPIAGHTHKSCANCREYALRWRSDLLRECSEPNDDRQLELFDPYSFIRMVIL